MDCFPNSVIAFQWTFPDETVCAAWLVSMHRPEGFECLRCGRDHGWALRGKARIFECAECHRETTGTADHPARQQARPDDLILGGLSYGGAFERHPGPSAPKTTRAWILPHDVDVGRQAAAGHGRFGPQSVVGPGRDRRDLAAVSEPRDAPAERLSSMRP